MLRATTTSLSCSFMGDPYKKKNQNKAYIDLGHTEAINSPSRMGFEGNDTGINRSNIPRYLPKKILTENNVFTSRNSSVSYQFRVEKNGRQRSWRIYLIYEASL